MQLLETAPQMQLFRTDPQILVQLFNKTWHNNPNSIFQKIMFAIWHQTALT